MKKNFFLCDIRGTFDSNNKELRDQQLQEFVTNLSILKEVDKLDNLYFSFISSDNVDVVLKFCDELKPYLSNTNIKMGPQFSDFHVNIFNHESICERGKTNQIIQLLNSVDTGKIYFADDNILYHAILEVVMERKFPNQFCENFVLGNNGDEFIDNSTKDKGLDALNDLLENYYEQKRNISKLEKKYK